MLANLNINNLTTAFTGNCEGQIKCIIIVEF